MSPSNDAEGRSVDDVPVPADDIRTMLAALQELRSAVVALSGSCDLEKATTKRARARIDAFTQTLKPVSDRFDVKSASRLA